MRKFYIILIVLASHGIQLWAQQMPLDFSDNADQFNVFGGSTFAIIPSPTDTNNPTGQFFRSGSANLQGYFIDLLQPIDLDTNSEITLRFYAFDPNMHSIYVKLENGTNPDSEVSVMTTSQNMWSELTFDFSTVGGSGQYSRLVIRIDDGSAVPGAFQIDDINDGSVPTDPNELDVIYTELVWSDEFDSTTPDIVDTSKWYHQTFGPNGGQWFNGETQHYTDRLDNSYVENGFLNIVAKRESFSQDGVTLPFTSARLNSKFAFAYGRVDVRAKLPFGNGTWPAIWTLGKNINETGAYWQTQGFGTTTWPACGEIDIMEHGLHATNEVSCAIHTPSSFGNTVNTAIQGLPDVANEFHVYSVNWSPNQISFLIDDIVYYTYNPAVKDVNTWPFDLEQYLILNIAMEGFSGPADANFSESSMVIDYVRVYQESLSTDEFSQQSIRLFPNPTSDYLYVESNQVFDQFEIYDVVGKKVLIFKKSTDFIDISNLNSGIYLIKLYFEGGNSVTRKIVKR